MKNLCLIILLFISAFSMYSCGDDNSSKPDNDLNLKDISIENIENIVPKEKIDEYLGTLNPTLEASTKLELLASWLEKQDGVTKVEVFCVSCIETNPEQSELKITFELEEGHIDAIMDVSMSDPLRFSGYHESYN